MSKKREVKVVALKGLNSRDSINNVEDGWCHQMHNVAFREGKIRTVCDHKSIDQMNLGNYKIQYIFPILHQGEYIASEGHDIVHIRCSDGSVSSATTIKTLPSSVDMESLKISHFESTLFISYEMNKANCQDSFIFQDGKFLLSGIDTLSEMSSVDFSYEFNMPAQDNLYDFAARIMSVTTTTDGNGYKHITNVDKPYEARYAYLKAQDYLHGSVYIFFAYKMKDGSIFRNGRIHMLECECGKSYEVNSLFRSTPNGNQTHYYKNIPGFKVKMSFVDTTAIVPNRNIKSIVIYSTRNNPMYNFDNLHHDFPTESYLIESTMNANIVRTSAKCVRDKQNLDIGSSPFYAIAEVDFRSTTTVTLSANMYKDIEQKPIFTPIVSPHSYRSKGTIELNRRLHLYNISAQLYSSTIPVMASDVIFIDGYKYRRFMPNGSNEIEYIGVSVTLNINGESVVVNTLQRAHMYLKRRSASGNEENYDSSPYVILPNMISYPDARATKLDVFITRSISGITETLLIKSFDLQPSAANNYATYRNISRDVLMYYELFLVRNMTTAYNMVTNKSSYHLPNQVMVSEVGKPYLFYPQHVYYVGSSDSTAIEDANTPIDQLTESRFGQYPLYLFTTSGIYAMEQGTNAIYNSIVKVNTDVVKRMTNSVSAYGALYYFSSAGLMRLNGHVSSVASDVVNEEVLRFANGAKLLLIPEMGELMIVNRQFTYAYVYSLRRGVWSSRDFRGEMISYDTYLKDGGVYDLLTEDVSKPLVGSVQTRELLLGSREIKRIDRFKADILTKNGYTIEILASLDGMEWCEIARSESCDTIKRTSSSWKYYKVKIEGCDFFLDNLIIESFTRFVRHIR